MITPPEERSAVPAMIAGTARARDGVGGVSPVSFDVDDGVGGASPGALKEAGKVPFAGALPPAGAETAAMALVTVGAPEGSVGAAPASPLRGTGASLCPTADGWRRTPRSTQAVARSPRHTTAIDAPKKVRDEPRVSRILRRSDC
ncbi:MAG: hypothetical protein LAO51_11450 [Acidobacteriia bacterium]|nr:hypothetical protein [Terriglobia bacterium]